MASIDWSDGLTVQKDPDAVLDYKWDFLTNGWLATGETISSHSVSADTGITVDDSTNDDDSVTVWLSGGTVGVTYEVSVRIVTNQARTDDRTVRFLVTER
jgi:hypothetical protein